MSTPPSRSGQVWHRPDDVKPDQFPFAAVVGQDDAKLGLLLAALDPKIGGVLLRGAKGSAKTTLARGLADLLPGDAPFVELPLGATEDRVIGSIDLAAALTGEGVRFAPGLLAAAHGGVLYVDEVNLLADHLVDVLLDVATSGMNRVEREGVAHSHASRFVLVGSMNPEEGELRPQLLDRFGLSVDVVAETDPDRRAEAVTRRLGFDSDPGAAISQWAAEQDALRGRVADSRPAVVGRELARSVSALCATLGVESLRGDLVTCRAAAALAGFEGREQAGVDDVRRVAPLALAHRRRRQPFEQPGLDPGEVDQALADREPSVCKKVGPGDSLAHSTPPERSDGPDRPAAPPGPEGSVITLATPRAPSGPQGRRSSGGGALGRLVGDRVPDGPVGSVAVAATVRAAAARSAGGPPVVVSTDVREAVRDHKVANLVVVAVDASGSMGAAQRMEAAKGAVVSLLLDAYQRRDRVAMVTFRGEGATVVLRPTGSVEVARARLADLPTGGRTPLAAGIRAALEVALGADHQEDGPRPLLVVVSDGRATAGPPGVDPLAAALEAAGEVRSRGVAAVVVDAEEGPTRLGLAAELATAMGARCLTIAELTSGALSSAVRPALS